MVAETTEFEKTGVREMALGIGNREGRWKEEANNLLPSTTSGSNFSYANGWEFTHRGASTAKIDPRFGYKAGERVTLAL
jgi:hypothetical protein